MTFDTDYDVDVYFRQAFRAPLFIPACCLSSLQDLNLQSNPWGYFSVFQILSFYISVPSEYAAV